MQIYRFPEKRQWTGLLTRPAFDSLVLEEKIGPLLDDVRKNGDKALRKYTKQFDGADLAEFALTDRERYFALNQISSDLFDAIKLAAANITTFHRAQVSAPEKIDTMPGVTCWRKNVAIQKVGLYVPGGTAPLFSTVLMLAIPAIIAGCEELVLCTPPSKDGAIHPAVVAAATYIGVKKIFKVGGAQAIAAMAFGTESIPAVDKIFGPGNQYVTAAKQMVTKYGVAIDMPAGPSEVAVYADSTANPAFVAADLLSQAEHGSDSQVLLVTTDESIISRVEEQLRDQLERLPRKDTAMQAMEKSKIILAKNIQEAMSILNQYAPEHLILATDDAMELGEQVVNAGSVFLGHYTPESAGDYASGTNHTLPTNGYARTYSGVSVDSFVKKITFQQLTREGIENIGGAVETMAEAEGLKAHAEAIRIRRQEK